MEEHVKINLSSYYLDVGAWVWVRNWSSVVRTRTSLFSLLFAAQKRARALQLQPFIQWVRKFLPRADEMSKICFSMGKWGPVKFVCDVFS